MYKFIMNHPIVTWLIVGEICSCIKTCVCRDKLLDIPPLEVPEEVTEHA